jgi:hypothetical protein
LPSEDDRAHDRQTGRSRPLGHDAADLRRLLQPGLNEIVFPAGILQPPAFYIDAVDAVNYGAIGVVIGHEISHGFDDQGAQYDYLGRLRNWWTEDDLKNFPARAACVADQFDHYYIEKDIHHNGKLVLGESIGDLGGAKIAYLAYQKSLRGQAASGGHRRLHSGAAVLHRLGPIPRRRDSPRSAAPDGAGRSPSHRQVPRHRPVVESPGISEGVELQSGCSHGPPRREKMRRVVGRQE